ncbi:hypothetical protein GLAREA_03239 [Glarea lozoyensis ATCC 20868]|uniref:Uncharacterized protein n=1 Tax=Glarea lozoyensis (strain ATCC 20868 / MF5171) TaxID=1116229 RepID=S3CQE4_GLAL2|nr:uncharacterized protein GLAREA_03239 [Glarea lozoyensis ATCC 20868]EPE27324.1 hypothetical protein GLAREA_03239 [Glarea lozoyensis ATCC 20868]
MASSHITKVQPSSCGGYGRQPGPYGGIEGIEFTAQCPPDIQKGTRVIAVCGIPESMAAPDRDGWFFSDFFSFYQMLRSRPELSNQLWLSSCSPADLINKHGRYLHGPASGVPGDRRIVMDAKLLPDNEMEAGFRVLKPKDLLERFLATLKSEIGEADKLGVPVLVLIFGHGEEDTSGISIGCEENGHYKLNKSMLASVLNPKVQTTLLSTSCYSGGWVIHPNLSNHFDTKPALNLTIITAAGNENESLSWPVSQTAGRQAGGSVFATCLLEAIYTASDNGKLSMISEEDCGVNLSDTMAGLTSNIITECEKRFGDLWKDHGFSFAEQDDLWEQAWGKRTGLPLLNYRERWERLPEASLTKIRKAARYMSSNPGRDNAGGNTLCHARCNSLLSGKILDFQELYELNEALDHRQGQISLAGIYCQLLGIGFPENRRTWDFNDAHWEHAHLIDESKGSVASANMLKRYNTIKGWVIRLRLFNKPLPYKGQGYSKPKKYLACRLAETPMSMDVIREKLEGLLQCKLKEARRLARSPLGQEILDQPEIKTLRGRLYESVGRLKHRLRSLSPRKRTRMTEDDS